MGGAGKRGAARGTWSGSFPVIALISLTTPIPSMLLCSPAMPPLHPPPASPCHPSRPLTPRSSSPPQVWNLANCKLRNNLAGHQGYVNTVTVSPDGSLCASGGKDGVAMLWDLQEGKRLYSLDAGDIIHSLVFSPNRYWLCAATQVRSGGRQRSVALQSPCKGLEPGCMCGGMGGCCIQQGWHSAALFQPCAE